MSDRCTVTNKTGHRIYVAGVGALDPGQEAEGEATPQVSQAAEQGALDVTTSKAGKRSAGAPNPDDDNPKE